MSNPETLIELYDPSTHLYNALGVMLFRPRRVIFLIPEHSERIYNKYKNEYRRIWQDHGCLPENTSCILTGTSDMTKLALVIREVAGPDTVLDIEGGTPELFLAAGYVCAETGFSIRCVRMDFHDGMLTEYLRQGNGEVEAVKRAFTDEEKSRLMITVDECVRIYGGQTVSDTVSDLIKSGMTTDEIREDAKLLWSQVGKKLRDSWNSIVPDKFHEVEGEPLSVYVNGNDKKIKSVKLALSGLLAAGLITDTGTHSAHSYYKCKSPAVFRCLRKAGDMLELYTYAVALAADPVTDAKTGICVAYSGEDGSSDNELDGFCMVTSTPLFISCKNGSFDSNELYKFHIVSSQFGGQERISVLIAPNFVKSARSTALIERGELYGIDFITDFCDISFDDAVRELESIISRKRRLIK